MQPPASTSWSPADKTRLALEIVVAYVRVQRSLGRRDLPGLVADVRATPASRGSHRPIGDDPPDGARLGRAVVRTIAALPSGTRCLTRSLVLLSLLARRGVKAELVIAVQPMAPEVLDAHAWIEVDGRPLLVPALGYGRLVTL